MKKLLVLMLVLGIATLASAGLQISVGGVQEPIDSEIILAPSDTIELDIWTDADIGMFEAKTWALLVADKLVGTITGGTSPVGYADPWPGDAATDNTAMVIPQPYTGKAGGYLAGMSDNPLAGAVLYDSFIFHCEGEGDAVIELWEMVNTATLPDENYEMTTLLDTVIIHQIPEPMTMALLGLGGLFLRRRK